MNYSDIRKKYGLTEEKEEAVTPSPKKDKYNQLLSKHGLSYDQVDNNYITTFITDANNFLSSAQGEHKKVEWSNATSTYETRNKTWQDLRARSASISKWLSDNKSNLDKETYNTLSSAIRSFRTGSADGMAVFEKLKDYYSQWETQEDYDFWESRNTTEKRQQLYADNQSRIEELESFYDEAYTVETWYNSYRMNPDAWDEETVNRNMTLYNKLKNEYGSLSNLETEIDRLKTDNLNYKRGNYNEKGQYYGSKDVDDYHYVTQKSDFDVVSANRDHGNPTREELTEYDALTDSSTWYYDENNILRDAYGNEIVKDSSGNLVNPKAQEYTVTDRLGIYLSSTEKEREEYAGTIVSGTWGNIIGEGVDGSWDQLYQEEIGIYYYLLNTSGQEVADKYLSDMKTELNRRETMKASANYVKEYSEANFLEKIGLNIATVPAQLISGVAGTIENAAMTIMGEDINPYSYAHRGSHFSQTIRGKTAEDWDATGLKLPIINFTLGDLYQSGMSILDSFASIGIGGSLGGALLASSAASSEATRLYEQGASMGQIAVASLAAGAAEMVFESLSIDKLINLKDAKTAGQFVKNLLAQGGIEASEEGFTEIANILTNAIVMGNQSDWAKLIEENGGDAWKAFLSEVQAVAHASLAGFFSGVGSATIPSAVSYGATQAQYAKTGKDIAESVGGMDALKKLANEVAGVSDAKMQKSLNKQIASLDKKASNRKAGKLYEAVGNSINAQNKADIVTILEMNKFGSEEANSIADAIVALASGEQLTSQQKKTLYEYKDSAHVKDIIKNYNYDDSHSIGKRNKALAEIENGFAISVMAKEYTEKAFTPEGKYKVSDTGESTALVTEVVDGKTITKDTGEVIDIKGIASISKGKMLLNIGDGKTIDAKNVAYANKKDALIYEAIANLGDNIDADTANKLIAKFDGGNAMVFARGITQAYTYGFYGLDRSEMKGKHTLSAGLTEEQRNYAYGLGEKYRPTKDMAAKVQAQKDLAKSGKTPSEKGVYYRDKDGNATDISTYLKESNIKLNDIQKTGIEAMRKLSEALGVRFNVFESWVENGTRYYLDENGDKVEGNPNGFYDTTTGEIYIDLNAGNDYQGTILFTVAHEMTHFMRQWSPEHFAKIASIVFKHGGMKGNVSELIAHKQAQAKAKGKPISYDTAMEEVVADGMETILKNGKVVEFMADVKKKDHAAWEKLKGWFKNLAKFLRKMVWAYRGQSAQTVEGAKVAEFSQDLLSQIERIFAEGVVASGENYSRVESIVGQINISLDDIMALDTVYTIDSSNATPYTGIRKDDEIGGKNVFKGQGGFADRPGFGKVVLGRKSAVNTVFHGNGPAKQAAFPAVKAVIENGIEICRDINHKGRGYDTVTFAAPIDFFRTKAPLGVVVQVFDNGRGDKSFYIHEICDAEGNYIELVDGVPTKKEISNTGEVEPTSTADVADDGISPNTNIHNDSEIVKGKSAEALDIEVDEKTESVAPTVLKSERTWKESDYVQEYKDSHQGAKFSDRDSAETTRFSPRDTSSVPADISSFVNTALTDRKSNQQMEITVATALDNKAIHRLGLQFNGHYGGSARTMTSRYIRHIINNHGDPIIEALRGQLHMDGDAIKIALSKLQSGAGRVVGKGESVRGNPTILTEIPINGYTLYAEEPVEQLSGTDLEGRTMFMTPTSTKVLLPTNSASVPQRRSEGHRIIIDGKKRIVNSFLTDASGNIAEVNYIDTNGSPYASGNTLFLYTMCNDTDVLAQYAPEGATIKKANVGISNPYIVTPQNPVFAPEDLEKGRVAGRVKEIKSLGYDAIIMDYKPGDNYMVLAFDKKSVVKLSDRDTDSVSNRSLLANAFEGLVQNEIEKNKLQEYKGKIDLINAEEKKLRELNEQIKELSFAKGPRDKDKISKLRDEATKTANRINTYDKQLLRLEASKPLQDVLTREKKRAYKKAEQRGKEALADYKEKTAKAQRELLEKWQESRKKAVENRNIAFVRGKIKNFKAKLERTLLQPTDRQYVPIDLIKAMVEVCELIDTDTDLYKADGSINKAQQKRDETKEKLQNLKDEYEKLKTNSDPIYAGEFDEMVYTYLTDLRNKFSGKSIKDMSLDDLSEMYEILVAIDETLRDARKLIGWGDAENVYEAGDAIVAEQRNIAGSRKNGKRNILGRANDSTLNLSLSPVRNVERMSGYNGDSYLLKLFKKFEKGIRKKNMFMMNAYKSFEQLTSGKEYDDAIYNEVGGKKYTDVKGRKFRVSKMQMMQAILSYERELANSNLHHIEKGGFTFADLYMLRKGKLKEAVSAEHSHRIPSATAMVAEFQEILKDDKWCQDYMAVAREFFNKTAKDAINETSIVLKHRIIAKDKSYIPFEVDTNFVNLEITDMNAVQKTINGYGMLKDTQEHAPQPLYITGLNNILDRHIEQVGNVYGLAIEVRNFNKVWNAQSADGLDKVKEMIETNWGKGGVEHIEQAVKDIQGSRVRERNALTAVYDKVKSGYISATFLLNLSVVTKQIGSLYSSTSMLRWRDPVRQLGNLIYTMANSEKISAEVDKYTASAWMRRQGVSDAELHTLMTEGKKTWWGRLWAKAPAIANPTKWITAMDHAVALSLWRYAKIDTAKKTGLKGEELLKATAEFYDEVIENTQSMTDALHRPEIQKQNNIFAEAFAMFKTDLYQMAGQLHITAGRFGANKTKENGKALGRTLYAVAMSAIWGQLMTTVFALLRYKVKPYRDEEDGELTAESWLKRQGFAFAGDVIGYLFPILGSEVVGFFENIKYGESEDIAESLALTLINDLYDSMITIGTSIKDKEMPDLADMRKLTAKVLQVFGVPANNILRTWDAIELHGRDIANGEFLSFEAGVDRTAAQHIHRIMEAVESGNGDIAAGLYEEAIEEIAIRKSKDGSWSEDELKEAKSDMRTTLGKKYQDGEISKDTTNMMLSVLFGDSPEEVDGKIAYWDFVIDNPDSDVSSQWFITYYEKVGSSGIDLDTYVEYRTLKKNLTKKEEISEAIHSMDLSKEQKDALYLAEGYAKSTLDETPWH